MCWLGNRVTEARNLLYQLEQWKLSAIPREANMVAHGFVRQMEIWMEDAPTFILHAIQADVTR